jgi:hypothetical protein
MFGSKFDVCALIIVAQLLGLCMWKWMYYADMKLINPPHRWVFWTGSRKLGVLHS